MPCYFLSLLALALSALTLAGAPRPNVIIVMPDDVGYGDLGCHGSPFAVTPHFDALHAEAVRLVDFHVAPMCSPTRGQLLTGRDALRNGSSIVAGSRMMVRAGVPMLPEFFAAAGYATGLFGKWHLGENHPHRPGDRGWQEARWFGLQEIGSLADRWENDYFDPWLRHADGRVEQARGYCTDIFFAEAMAWMRAQQSAAKPFLCYLPLNVCHGPQWAPSDLREKYARAFPGLTPAQVGYLAMLANVDENFGRLEAFLRTTGLRENTIVIFLTDNGGYALGSESLAKMRDGKSRLAEGGHRVPCFVRWPAGQIVGGREVAGLTQVQDLAPTLLDLAAVPAPGAVFDGMSLAPSLRGEGAVPERTLIVQYGLPEPFRMTCVLRGRWRLLSDIKGAARGEPELYDLERDPLQRTNLYAAEPARAAELHAAYEAWWRITAPLAQERAFISLGHQAQAVVTLSSAEWRDGAMASVEGLRQGVKRRGVWDIEVTRAGDYEIALRRWPEESGLPLGAPAPAWTPRDTATPGHTGWPPGRALPIAAAELRVGELRKSRAVAQNDLAAVFHVALPAGRTTLEGTFWDAAGEQLGSAYFVTVQRRP